MLMTHWLYLLREPNSKSTPGNSQEATSSQYPQFRKGLRPEEIAFRLKRQLTPVPVLAVVRQKRFRRANQPDL